MNQLPENSFPTYDVTLVTSYDVTLVTSYLIGLINMMVQQIAHKM